MRDAVQLHSLDSAWEQRARNAKVPWVGRGYAVNLYVHTAKLR